MSGDAILDIAEASTKPDKPTTSGDERCAYRLLKLTAAYPTILE